MAISALIPATGPPMFKIPFVALLSKIFSAGPAFFILLATLAALMPLLAAAPAGPARYKGSVAYSIGSV